MRCHSLIRFHSLVFSITLTLISFHSLSFGQTQQPKDDSQDKEKVDFPETEIFLFPIAKADDDKMTLGDVENVTNRKGYDNQPFFAADSKSFLYSRSDEYQTDAWAYYLETKKHKRVTNTPYMEFSPTPSADMKKISFVTDGEGANQSIWHIESDNPTKPIWTLSNQPEREPVGYYSWNHETGFIVFWSRYGHAIRLVHESKELSHYITGHAVPTTPWIIPGTKKFSFVHRQANGSVWIKELDPETRAVRPLVSIPGTNHHYNWSPDGSIVMVQGLKLMRWKEGDESGWSEIADLEKQGITTASRVALSPDGKWLAVVGQPLAND